QFDHAGGGISSACYLYQQNSHWTKSKQVTTYNVSSQGNHFRVSTSAAGWLTAGKADPAFQDFHGEALFTDMLNGSGRWTNHFTRSRRFRGLLVVVTSMTDGAIIDQVLQ